MLNSISGPIPVRAMEFAGRGVEWDSVPVWLSQLRDKGKPCHAKAPFLTLAEIGTTQARTRGTPQMPERRTRDKPLSAKYFGCLQDLVK